MSELHVTVASVGGLSSDLIHFTTSLLITLLMLALTVRAARFPGTPGANILFAICGILWSAGGLLAVAQAAGFSHSWVWAPKAIQFTGAAPFPIAILAVWRPLARSVWQKRIIRALLAASVASAVIIVAMLWLGGDPALKTLAARLTIYNAAVPLTIGAAVTLRPGSTPRAVLLLSLAIVVALCVTMAATLAPHAGFLLNAAAAHLVLLMVLCAFLLFARFRFADLFIRYTVRILLAAFWAGALAMMTRSPTPWLLVHGPSPELIHTFLLVLAVNLVWVSFAVVERVSTAVNRLLFRAPDYRAEARALGNRLREMREETQVTAAVEDAARRPLELAEARIVAMGNAAQWPAGVMEGEVVDRGVELLIPVATGGHFTHLLLAAPGPVRPGLVSRDVDYLRGIALQFGNRLDALARERDAVDRQSREALLQQQITEAELTALRAQINPHFLFNSLNTVADLIVRDPARAEAMTLRLAGVFRHVLAHSRRPLTTIRDEMEFLRTYLYIEEARFGDRLGVLFDVDPAVLPEQAPSLILQPLVENALKHGLGPKPGPGSLWISARAVGTQIRLRVEDDGMGLAGRSTQAGLGLTNVAERLATLYQDRAAFTLEPRTGGGCCATVLIPRTQAVTE